MILTTSIDQIYFPCGKLQPWECTKRSKCMNGWKRKWSGFLTACFRLKNKTR